MGLCPAGKRGKDIGREHVKKRTFLEVKWARVGRKWGESKGQKEDNCTCEKLTNGHNHSGRSDKPKKTYPST